MDTFLLRISPFLVLSFILRPRINRIKNDDSFVDKDQRQRERKVSTHSHQRTIRFPRERKTNDVKTEEARALNYESLPEKRFFQMSRNSGAVVLKVSKVTEEEWL